MKEIAGEFLAIAVGWSIRMVMLTFAFGIGHLIATLLGGEPELEVAFGLLSALAYVWTAEGKTSREEFDALWALQRSIAKKVGA